MTHDGWHVPTPTLARFVTDPAGLDDTTAASIEAHLVACNHCRLQLVAAADPEDLVRSWDAVADRIDRPPAGAVERVLQRAGLGSGLGRLVAATPALRLAGLLVTAAVAVAAALVSRSVGADGPFLVLAPLAPLAAVAASFAPLADPAGEASVATPLWGAGLVLRRALVVLLSTFGCLAAASLGLPAVDARSLVWMLPALALSLGALALATWVRVEVAVVALAAVWLAVVFASRWLEGREAAFVDAAAFGLSGQASAFALALGAGAIAVARRGTFATLEAFR